MHTEWFQGAGQSLAIGWSNELIGVFARVAKNVSIFCILPFLQQGQRVMSIRVSRSIILRSEWVTVGT